MPISFRTPQSWVRCFLLSVSHRHSPPGAWRLALASSTKLSQQPWNHSLFLSLCIVMMILLLLECIYHIHIRPNQTLNRAIWRTIYTARFIIATIHSSLHHHPPSTCTILMASPLRRFPFNSSLLIHQQLISCPHISVASPGASTQPRVHSGILAMRSSVALENIRESSEADGVGVSTDCCRRPFNLPRGMPSFLLHFRLSSLLLLILHHSTSAIVLSSSSESWML